MLIEIATGPPDTNLPGLVNNLPTLDEGTKTDFTSIICGFQKAKNPLFVNFNRSGFIAFVVLGIIVIFSPLVVLPITQKLLSAKRRLAWVEDDNLQLLRMAHEGKNIGGTWEQADEGVPMPEGGATQVGVLDISNEKHPTIQPQPNGAGDRLGHDVDSSKHIASGSLGHSMEKLQVAPVQGNQPMTTATSPPPCSANSPSSSNTSSPIAFGNDTREPKAFS